MSVEGLTFTAFKKGHQSLAKILDVTLFDLTLRLPQGFLKARIIKWLQEVIERMKLEGLERIVIEGRYKDYDRQLLGLNVLQNTEAIHLWHLDIQKNKIR